MCIRDSAGAVEAIVCVKTLQEGFIHQTVGTKETDAECDLDYTTVSYTHLKAPYVKGKEGRQDPEYHETREILWE